MAPDEIYRRLFSENSTTYTSQVDPSMMMALLIALDFQSKIMLCQFTGGAICFFVGFSLVLVAVFSSKRGDQPAKIKKLAVVILFLASAVTVAATVSVMQTANAIQFIIEELQASYTILAGTTLLVLQWLASALSFIVASGATVWLMKMDGAFANAKASPSPVAKPIAARHPPPPPPPPPVCVRAP